MSIRNLIRKERPTSLLARRREDEDLFGLQDGINRLFDEFFGESAMEPFRRSEERMAMFSPRVDVAETETAVNVTAELPGLDEKDVEVTIDEETLTIRGEKKEEKEEKKGTAYRMERTYGEFHRVIPLPATVETGKAKATFKKGVLQVTLPKVPGRSTKGRKIEIKTE